MRVGTYRGTAAAAGCNRATAARNAMITTCSAFILQQTSERAGEKWRWIVLGTATLAG